MKTDVDPEKGPALSPANELCLACGMCCAGTIYSVLPIGQDEVEASRAAGMTISAGHEGEPAAALPCPHLNGTACGLYDQWRPRTCGEYMCRLQQRMGAGEIGLTAAKAEVARLKELIADRLPETAHRPLRELVIEAAALTRAGPIPPEKARMVMMVGAVNREIDQVIRYAFQASFAP